MEELAGWEAVWGDLQQYIGKSFGRRDTREVAKEYVRGLVAPVERKNGWQLAEMTGQTTPYKIQQFLYRGRWESDEVRNQLQRYVKEYLGSPEGVLVVDETGFLKKGRHSAGVQRQYSGTAGRIENCQIGVFLSYATLQGYTFVDRQLYLPESWTNDQQRCRAAGIPERIRFQTKPEIGLNLIQCAVANGIQVRWVTGDSIYGDYRTIRLWLEEQSIGYVMGVSGKEYVWQGYTQRRVSTLLAALDTVAWTRLSAGEGSKGPRLYEWLLLPVNSPPFVGWERHLLVRRSLNDPTALSAYACCAPTGTPLATLVQVAGTRWTIEAAFESAKGEVGLDQYEVRSWQGWYRHITLACFAHAFLTVLRAHLNSAESLLKNSPLHSQRPTAFLPFKLRRQQPSR